MPELKVIASCNSADNMESEDLKFIKLHSPREISKKYNMLLIHALYLKRKVDEGMPDAQLLQTFESLFYRAIKFGTQTPGIK